MKTVLFAAAAVLCLVGNAYADPAIANGPGAFCYGTDANTPKCQEFFQVAAEVRRHPPVDSATPFYMRDLGGTKFLTASPLSGGQ